MPGATVAAVAAAATKRYACRCTATARMYARMYALTNFVSASISATLCFNWRWYDMDWSTRAKLNASLTAMPRATVAAVAAAATKRHAWRPPPDRP